MAIVTIGQIKHRRGILGIDPMPQLASAELGWAVDQQELYIGNGTISEGAPITGNTEILTEHSNLSLLLDYIYTGPFAGAAMSTSAGLPIERAFVERFDDNVNVRAFGAGPGETAVDNSDAIERAINQHTLEQLANNEYWTTIYLPAGTYDIDRPLPLPSRVRLVGDGFTSTIIRLVGAGTSVLSIQEFTAPGPTQTSPEDIHIVGIGFEADISLPGTNGLIIGDAENVLFENVAFDGGIADTTVIGTSNAGVMFNNVNKVSLDIKFVDCLFTRAAYGIISGNPSGTSRQDVNSITVSNSRFYDLFKGANVGEQVLGTDFPTNWSIVHNTFDKIAEQGIHGFNAARITSGQNMFADVGNGQAGVGSPITEIITLGDTGGENPLDTILDLTAYEGSYSIGDVFDRDDADNALFLRINTNCLNSYAIDPREITWGTLKVEPGRLILLADNTAAPAPTGVTLDSAQYQGAIIDYQLNRTGNQVRVGTIEIANGTTSASFSEEYTEDAAVGVTLSLDDTTTPGTAIVEYTSTDEYEDIVFSYSIRHLTCIIAPPPFLPLIVDIAPGPGLTAFAVSPIFWAASSGFVPPTIDGGSGPSNQTYLWTLIGATGTFTIASGATTLNPSFTGGSGDTATLSLTVTDSVTLEVVADTVGASFL